MTDPIADISRRLAIVETAIVDICLLAGVPHALGIARRFPPVASSAEADAHRQPWSALLADAQGEAPLSPEASAALAAGIESSGTRLQVYLGSFAPSGPAAHEPDDDPWCARCGHHQSDHPQSRQCGASVDHEDGATCCHCQRYTPPVAPAPPPPPAEPLAPGFVQRGNAKDDTGCDV